VKRSRENGEKATDDYHYERFKKQFRRYWAFQEACCISLLWRIYYCWFFFMCKLMPV
jgi:hypothetical protein